jgi:hypothetical protein
VAQVIADILEVLDGKGRVTSTSLLLVPLRETGTLNDTLTHAHVSVIRETAEFNDGITGYVTYDLAETAVITGQASSIAYHLVDVRESAKLDDRLSDYVRVEAAVLRDTAELNDTLHTDTTYVADLRDTAALGDTITFAHTRTTTLREQARLDDRLHEYSIPADLRETAALGDTVSSYLVLRADIREIATLGDTISVNIRHAVDIREAAALGDRVSSLIVRSADLHELAYLEDDVDAIVTQDPNTVPEGVDPIELAPTDAWTANVESWAMSEYRAFPINQQVGAYGFGPEGTYINGVGETLTSFFETGTFELAQDLRDTRIMWVWFEGTMSDDITLKATTRNVKEYEASHEYQPWDDVHTDVQKYGYKIGRGLRGRRWTLRFMAQNDVTFDLKRLLVARVDTV